MRSKEGCPLRAFCEDLCHSSAKGAEFDVLLIGALGINILDFARNFVCAEFEQK